MCFHGNQHPWAIKHPFISLYFKYQSLKFICLPVMNSPLFPGLDDIYCTRHELASRLLIHDMLTRTRHELVLIHVIFVEVVARVLNEMRHGAL